MGARSCEFRYNGTIPDGASDVAQMAFNTVEIKIATSIEESAKLLQQQG